jgi:hypothetical protein
LYLGLGASHYIPPKTVLLVAPNTVLNYDTNPACFLVKDIHFCSPKSLGLSEMFFEELIPYKGNLK